MKRCCVYLIVVAMGCGAPEPESAFGELSQGGGQQQGGLATDGGADNSGTTPSETPPAPQVEALPPTWSYEMLPIRGQAQPGTLITITGGADSGGAAEGASAGDGRFCAEVRLVLDAENTLEVRASTTGGLTSPPTRVTVVQTGRPPEPSGGEGEGEGEGEGGPVNIAPTSPYAWASPEPSMGDYFSASDGDASTFMRVSFWDWDIGPSCDAAAWYEIGFDRLQTIDTIKIRWVNDWAGRYGTQYHVLVSEMPEPGDPSTTSGNWTVVGQQGCGMDVGDGDVDTFTFESPVSLMWAAVVMYEDGFTKVNEIFDVHEFELWSPAAPVISDNPIAPTCDNGR